MQNPDPCEMGDIENGGIEQVSKATMAEKKEQTTIYEHAAPTRKKEE